MPMDIEWAKDGLDGQLYILQARPETVASRRGAQAVESFSLTGTAPVLVTGKAVGERIATGRCAGWAARRISPPSGRARCWWPRRPARTGSR
ncbi:PEP/pyruvate-binding domain-containing protein [Teichococcus aestuarii]|uniref:PEP/pyruvate-binding domain-containing protein n=1 Tax=Teichococcus aestuarii TaxID=568898 RepID=UPI0036133D73